MELSRTLEGIGEDLRRTAALGGAEAAQTAENLIAALEPALRLRLMEALREAAEELAASLPSGAVEVRLEGRDPVLALVIGDEFGSLDDEPFASPAVEAELTRVTLRLPESLKRAVERAAQQAGQSVNTWLVEAAGRRLQPDMSKSSQPFGRRGPKRLSGYVRG